jgi:hypothetical protein
MALPLLRYGGRDAPTKKIPPMTSAVTARWSFLVTFVSQSEARATWGPNGKLGFGLFTDAPSEPEKRIHDDWHLTCSIRRFSQVVATDAVG